MPRNPAAHLAIFLAACLSGGLAAAPLAAASALAPESLSDFSWVSDPQIAPDGRRTAFLRTVVDAKHDDYASDLWLIEGSAAARALTASGDVATARWSPDGTRLAFLSKRSGKRQVYVLELSGGEAWQLTDDADGVATFSWSPDGKRIAFLSRALLPGEAPKTPVDVPAGHSKPAFVTERLSTRADGRPGWLPERRAHLWVVPTDAGASAQAQRITGGDFDDGAPEWSHDGATIYFSAVRKPEGDRATTDTEIYAVPVAGGAEPRALTAREGPDDGPRVSPDGRWIAYTGFDDAKPPQSYNVNHLYVQNLASGEVRHLAANLDRSIDDGVIGDMGSPRGEGGGLVWRADSQAVYFVSADRGVADLMEATLDGKYRALTHLADGDIRAFDIDRSGHAVAVHSRARHPAELVGFPLKDAGRTEAWRMLTTFNAAVTERSAFVPYEEFWFKGSAPLVTLFDGHAPGSRQWIQSWILKPPGFDPAGHYPAVLYIHGGPHAMYGTAFFHEMQVLAHAGYVVLISNPRGSTGYGEKFADVIHNHYPGDDYKDLMAGVDALIERSYVDPARLFVAGGSGGGLLSAWIVGHTERFRAAVVERAVINWYSFVGAADMNYWFATRWFSDTPWHDSADYLARSPISYVDAVKTPVLVIHNQDDYRVPLDQGLQFYTALKMLGKPARLAVFPESSHGMSRDGRPGQRIERLNMILDWFAAHGGAAR
jgi:acylaminoacyl-peptidase